MTIPDSDLKFLKRIHAKHEADEKFDMDEHRRQLVQQFLIEYVMAADGH